MSDPNQGKPAQPDPAATQVQTPQPGQPGQVQAGAPSPHLQQPQQAGQPAQPQPGPAAQPGQSGHPELRRGSQGDAVRELQGRLQVPWLKQDGDFGEATEQAVKAYQQSQGLTADGVVGPETWAKLDHVVGGVQQAQHT
jgi:peptidoglycan hydrolase-like protein with peptidoglycan-binding domain